MSDFLKKLGFQSAPYLAGNNAMYNPSSGATITTNSMGERMVDAPFLSSPQKMKSTKKDDDINPVQEFGYNPYEPSRVSLFGDPKPGLPKTDAMKRAEASYAAGFARSPEALAYNQRVNDLIQAGIPIGYGIGRTADGRIINGQGQEVTGYGYANEDATTPTFLTGGQQSYDGMADAARDEAREQERQREAEAARVAREQDRFDAFNRNINTQLAGYGDYTVNSDLDAGRQALRSLLLDAQNYDTDIDVNLRDPQSRIQLALDDLDRLRQDRTYQQGIVDDARRAARDNLTNFGRSYTDVDYRNMQSLDALSRQLDDIVNPDLNVELAYDFSDMGEQVDPYREIVSNMRDRRMRELNRLGEDISGLGNTLDSFYMNANTRPDGSPMDSIPTPPGGLPGADRTLREIENASEVYDIRDRLNTALNSLDAFGVGDRSNELREQIFGQDETYSLLADQLRDRQGQIEADAQAQLDALSEARLTRPDDIRSFEQSLRDLSGQRDLFDAAVAADELQRLTDQISSRRSDLERDQAAQIARQELERRRALQTQGGGRGFNSNMTADQYSAYLRNLEMGRDDPFYRGSGFSRALGLA